MFSSYSEVYHNCKSEYTIEKRYDLVLYAKEFGIKAAARHFKCSFNTVRRWYRRYAVYGKKGLKNLSRAPKSPHKIISDQVINDIKTCVEDSKKKKKYVTSVNVQKKLGLENYNYFTINRYVQKFFGKRKSRDKDKSNGGSIDFKAELKPFELVQLDIKYLTDIDSLKPYFNGRNLCNYEITLRDVCSGYSMVAFCYEKSVYCTTEFLKRVFYPFVKSLNFNLKDISVQTDNGTENTNRARKTLYSASATESIFTKFVNCNFKKHRLIIPGHCTAQSEVESFHWTIERDCLAWDDIIDNNSLIACTSDFIYNYNLKNRFNCDYSPVEKISEYYDISHVIFPKPIIIY